LQAVSSATGCSSKEKFQEEMWLWLNDRCMHCNMLICAEHAQLSVLRGICSRVLSIHACAFYAQACMLMCVCVCVCVCVRARVCVHRYVCIDR
jgi:hypothetical protein